MVIEKLTDRECRRILAEARLARLGCALDDQPYIVPIHVYYHGAYLYGFATLGQKIEWMRQNPLVCVELDDVTTHTQWTSIVVFGRYEELADTPECACARSIAEDLFRRHPLWWEPAAIPLVGHQQRSRILFRILITHISGRRAQPDRQLSTP